MLPEEVFCGEPATHPSGYFKETPRSLLFIARKEVGVGSWLPGVPTDGVGANPAPGVDCNDTGRGVELLLEGKRPLV